MAPPTEHPGPGRRTLAEVEILEVAFNILDEGGTKAERIDRQDHFKPFQMCPCRRFAGKDSPAHEAGSGRPVPGGRQRGAPRKSSKWVLFA